MPTELLMATTPRVKGCCQVLPEPVPVERVEEAATLLRVLADPVRLQMLAMLSEASEPICVCDFTAAFEIGQATVSHHLARLREAGLVTSAKRGIWSFYALVPRLPDLAEAVLSELA